MKRITITFILSILIATAIKAQVWNYYHLDDNDGILEIQTFIPPQAGWYAIEAWGGIGGNCRQPQGTIDGPGGIQGAIKGIVYLNASDELHIVVSGRGKTIPALTVAPSPVNIAIRGGFPARYNDDGTIVTQSFPFDNAWGGCGFAAGLSGSAGGGGGSGSAVYVKHNANNITMNDVLMIAGGGGGGGYANQLPLHGGAGGRYTTTAGAYTYINGQGYVYYGGNGNAISNNDIGAIGATTIGGNGGNYSSGGGPGLAGHTHGGANSGKGGNGRSASNNSNGAGGGGGYAGGGGGATNGNMGTGNGGGGSSFISDKLNGEDVVILPASHYPSSYPQNANGSSNTGNGYVRINTLIVEAFNDTIITQPAISIDVPVLNNDIYTGFIDLSIIIPPLFGTAEALGDTIIRYTQNPPVSGSAPWEGLDVFEYEVDSPFSRSYVIPAETIDSAYVYLLMLDQNRFTCNDTETIHLEFMPPGASYTWYDAPSGGQVLATNTDLIVNSSEATDYVVNRWLSINYVPVGGTGSVFPNRIPVQIHFVPPVMVWNGSAGDSNWNNPENWEDTNGTTFDESGPLPWKCTNVIIPAGTVSYPVLKPAAEDLQALCDTIYFEFGGEVAKTSYLDYNAAKVDLTLQSGRWYMVAPILQQQYSGDYFADQTTFRRNPQYFMMYYQMRNPQNNQFNGEATWSAPFNNVDQLLDLCSGQAVWVDNGTWLPGGFTVHFPKDSTRYAYYNPNNQVTRYSGTIPRGNQYRFIYEENASYQAIGNGTFTQEFSNPNGYSQLIVGNPYLSHMDIIEFQNLNSSYFAPSFYIWKSGSPVDPYTYESYLIQNGAVVVNTGGDPPDDGTGVAGLQIPPMQSFIMNLISPVPPFPEGTTSYPIWFTPDMATTVPGQTLRSSSHSIIDNVVKLDILRSGVRQSGLAIRYCAEADRHFNDQKDVWTLIPSSIIDYVSLYTLVDGKALSIHTTGDLATPLDLGISIGKSLKDKITKGEREVYSIKLSGSNTQLNDLKVYLYDMQKDSIHDFKTPYNFVYELATDLTDRFQLLAIDDDDVPTNINQTVVVTDKITIRKINGEINVISTKENPIREVTVFSLLGQKLYGKSGLNTTNWSFNFSGNAQTIIVKVQTEKGFKTEKILLEP
jgi:hypothetical protein